MSYEHSRSPTACARHLQTLSREKAGRVGPPRTACPRSVEQLRLLATVEEWLAIVH